jgi:hypothetical protein
LWRERGRKERNKEPEEEKGRREREGNRGGKRKGTFPKAT